MQKTIVKLCLHFLGFMMKVFRLGIVTTLNIALFVLKILSFFPLNITYGFISMIVIIFHNVVIVLRVPLEDLFSYYQS